MIESVVAVVGIILGGLALIAAMVARWRTTSDETILKLTREERDVYRAKADRLESEFAAYRKTTDEKISRLSEQFESLQNENRILRSLNDYRDEISALRTDISLSLSNLPCQLIQKGDNS